jgi:cytochrome c oxidase assembly factor CtaG
MNPIFYAFLRSWPFEPVVLASLLLSAGVYLRGWLALHRRDPGRWPCRQPLAFGVGLSALFLALASPIELFTSLLLQVHMLQHMLLMMIAPPLLWLGAPFFPLLLGLPRPSHFSEGDAPCAGRAALHSSHMVRAPPADL